VSQEDSEYEITTPKEKSRKASKVVKSSAELCLDWQIEDVELEYDEEDFSTLTTFKLFSENIKPLVVADNAKLTGHKLNKFLQAKYREFVMQVPPVERGNYDTAGVGEFFWCSGYFCHVIACGCVLPNGAPD